VGSARSSLELARSIIMATDWTSFIPSIVTGIVGLAGIGGATWQAKRSRESAAADLRESLAGAERNLHLGIGAENERAHLAERRHIYAEYLAAINSQVLAITKLRIGIRNHEEKAKTDSVWAEVRNFVSIGNSARMALDLIASDKVIEKAISITGYLNQLQEETSEGQTTTEEIWPTDLELLGNAMRADLGEPPVSRF
jgi:hypothetical protein